MLSRELFLRRVDRYAMIGPPLFCEMALLDLKEYDMAEIKSNVMELSPLERGWIKQAVEVQKRVLVRSRQKEVVGGEIWILRGKEIDTLSSLLGRF